VDETDAVRAIRACPLVIAGAGVAARGRSTARIVEFLDIYPTLAELARVEAPARLHGRSLAPLLRNPQANWDHGALTQVRRGAGEAAFMGYSVRTDRWRYTEWDEGKRGTELYNEADDPHELTNLAAHPAQRERVAEMRAMLHRMKGQ